MIDWVMRAEGVSFRHAAELLRTDLPPEGLSKSPQPKLSTVPKLPDPPASWGSQLTRRKQASIRRSVRRPRSGLLAAGRGIRQNVALRPGETPHAGKTSEPLTEMPPQRTARR